MRGGDREVEASVRAALITHPAVRGVRLVGSRATGGASPLSDWDFEVDVDDFITVTDALPSLVAELEPIAKQWDRISTYACYMLMLAGPVKVDLIFPGEPFESRPPWTVTAETLDGIDQHFWDWSLWLASKREKGEHERVHDELVKMTDHLLGPMGVLEPPASIEGAVLTYQVVRDQREHELNTRVARRREREVLRVV